MSSLATLRHHQATTALTFACVTLALAAFAGAPGSRGSAPGDVDPVIAIWHTPGRSFDRAPDGLEFALWEDGTLLLAAASNGENLLLGKCAPADVKELMDRLRTEDLSKSHDWMVPDSAYTTIHIRLDGADVRRSWHESLNPGFGGDLSTDPEYQAFVRKWRRVRGAAASITPTEVRRLKDVPDAAALRAYENEAREQRSKRNKP